MQYSYLWEQSGRLEFARNLDDETLDRWFAYDHVGRLSNSRSGNEARLAIGEQVPLLYNGPYSHGYEYDKWGNITSRQGWGGANPQYSASYANNKMNGYNYDVAGNLIDAGGGWTFTYNATGQQATSAVGTVQNLYDGDGLRVKKTESGTTTYYLRSSVLGGQIVAEIAANGNWARGYVYAGGELLAVQQAGVFWIHEDPGVKSKRITNASGNVVSTVELDPWGGETNRSSNEVFQPRTFNTYLRDAIASDDAMHRRYNRWWSRFEQPDPYGGSYNLGDPQTFNRYSYVQNDPVNRVDPSGLQSKAVGPCPPGDPCEVTVFGGVGADDPRYLPSTGGPVETGGIRPREPIPRGGNRGDRPEPQNPSQIKEVTDCDLFAAEVARLGFANSDNLVAFVGALRERFAKEGDYIASPEFASSGFKDEFRDPDPTSSNQARHYVGAFRAAVMAGVAGQIRMNLRERPGKNDSPETTRSHQADLALNRVAFQHAGKLLSGQAKITDLQILVLKDICK